MTDHQLLREFLDSRSHAAFEAIVDRYVGLVYTAALRQTRDPSLSEDICQAVFMILARKAASLSPEVILPGWLIRATHLCAHDTLKTESRRKAREQRYAAMACTETNPAVDETNAELPQQIDRALSHLSEVDRGAIVLRYLQDQPVARVASALGLSEDAASKRLQRALLKLRDYFVRHPITPSVAALTLAMQHLPQATTSATLAKSAAAAALGTGAASSTSAGLIANSSIKLIAWTKAKVAAALLVGAMVGAAGAGAVSIVRAQTAATPVTPSTPVTPATPAAPVQAATGFTGHLSNGVWFELVGIGPSPSAGNSWWRADGSSLDQPPYERLSGHGTVISDVPESEQIHCEVAVRMNDKLDNNPDPATVSWGLNPSIGSTGSEPVRPRSPGLEATAYLLKRSDLVTLRVNVAAGPWRTLFNAGPQGESGSIGGLLGGSVAYSISGGFETNGQTHFVLACATEKPPAAGRSPDHRLIVIDKTNKTTVARLIRSSSSSQLSAGEYYVRIPLANIKSVQFQSRPFDQWIEVRNVCVDPAKPTQPTVVTSDDPPQGL